MNLKRFIPVLLIKNGLLVRSEKFKYHQAIGDPIPTIKRLSDWNADEIILLNIGSDNLLDSRRNDKYHNLGESEFEGLVREVTKFCHCPITIGGGIRYISQIENIFEAGADKIVVNTALYENSKTIESAVEKFGSQSITASIDIKTNGLSTEVYKEKGKIKCGLTLNEALDNARRLGVGEVLISSIDHDGSDYGYDQNIIDSLDERIDFPIIINSGATTAGHFKYGLENPYVDAVAASNIFYFTEMSYINLKKEIIDCGYRNLRKACLDSKHVKREPTINLNKRERLFKKGSNDSVVDLSVYSGERLKDIVYCKKCLYSSASASPMQFADDGICMGCKTYEAKSRITKKQYDARKEKLREIVEKTKKSRDIYKQRYDCIVSVSGGKDSYYQTHFIKYELGLNPLLVTYNGNNYTEIGWKNLWNMREAFDCDHVVVSPSVKTIKKLNKAAFIAMGDMNWHAHVGIYTTAPRIAIQQKIPLIFWGEHGYADLCGQFSMSDFPEMNYRERTEHAGRGFDWEFFVGIDGITEGDMVPWCYPSDTELFKSELRQIYLGHYIPWESNQHLALVRDKYGFCISDEKFERTYRTGSNLDDMHENGIHDYLKYIKFGYGRCTDHASKDIRSGDLTRAKGIQLVKAMDHIKPKDLYRWLDYVGMEECEFDRIADHFRDPRVWKWCNTRGWIYTGTI